MWIQFLIISLYAVLGFVAYSDFRYRGIYWWIFPLLFCDVVVLSIHYYGLETTIFNTMLNSFYLIAVLFITWIIFAFLKNETRNVLSGLIGTGDCLFLISVSSLFFPLVFFLFVTFSAMLSLAVYVLAGSAKRIQLHLNFIPLAGIQSIVVFIAMPFLVEINFAIEEYIILFYGSAA